MIYQVNTFDLSVGSTPLMCDTDIDKIVTKANECLRKGLDTEVLSWTDSTHFELTAQFACEPAQFMALGDKVISKTVYIGYSPNPLDDMDFDEDDEDYFFDIPADAF